MAQRLSLADLDACFDEATFLRNVHTVIARLDAIAPTSPWTPAAAAVPAAPPAPEAPAEVADADG